jgi:hypothetical protein
MLSEKVTSSDPLTRFFDLAAEPWQAINAYFAENDLCMFPRVQGLKRGRYPVTGSMAAGSV